MNLRGSWRHTLLTETQSLRTSQTRCWAYLLLWGLWCPSGSCRVRTSRLAPFGHSRSKASNLFQFVPSINHFICFGCYDGESLGNPETVPLLEIAILFYRITNLYNFWCIFNSGINPIDVPAGVFNGIYSRLFSIPVFVILEAIQMSIQSLLGFR